MFQVVKSQVIEIPTGATPTATISIPDQPQLTGVRIWGIEFLSDGVITKSPESFGTPLSAAEAKTGFLTLQDNNSRDVIRRMPLYLLNRTQEASGVPFVRDLTQLAGTVISWTKSNITFSTAPSANRVISLVVYFEEFSNR